jgi:ectoine hydroxylase
MRFSENDKTQFFKDGYLMVKQLFSSDEMQLLIGTTKNDAAHASHDGDSQDADGKKSKLRLRNYLEDDISSAFIATRRIVDNMEFLLDDEVYHFHHKMMLKEPRIGGAWE